MKKSDDGVRGGIKGGLLGTNGIEQCTPVLLKYNFPGGTQNKKDSVMLSKSANGGCAEAFSP